MAIADDIRNFNTQLAQIEDIVVGSCAKITRLMTGTVVPGDDIKDLAPDPNMEGNTRVQKPHETSPHNYYEDASNYPVGVPKIIGFNRHQENNQLFLSASPVTVDPEAPRHYLYNMLSTVAALTPTARRRRPTRIIVLGEWRDSVEMTGNLTAYHNGKEITEKGSYVTTLTETSRPDENRHIRKYGFEITPSETDTNAEKTSRLEAIVFFINAKKINAKKNEIDLTLKDFEQLHAIVELHKHAADMKHYYPVVVHCTQGLDRAPTIVFAMELYRDFDHFVGNTLENAVSSIPFAYETLRASRSPEALQSVADFKTSLYMAFMLKSIDLIAKAKNEIYFYCKDRRDNKDQKSILSMYLHRIDKNAEDPLTVVNEALNNAVLKTHPNSSTFGLSSFFGRRPSTESIELLTALRDALVARENIHGQLNALIMPSQSTTSAPMPSS